MNADDENKAKIEGVRGCGMKKNLNKVERVS